MTTQPSQASPIATNGVQRTCLTCHRQTCDRQPTDIDPDDCDDWKPASLLDPSDPRDQRIINASRAVRIVNAIEKDIVNHPPMAQQWNSMSDLQQDEFRIAWHRAIMRDLVDNP